MNNNPDSKQEALKRSHIPGNRALKQKQFCLDEAARYRGEGDKQREQNALSWAEGFQREHEMYEFADTLIHYKPVPEGVCERKDSKADERSRPVGIRGAVITETAEASHLENVNCLACRRWARTNPRRTWRCEHGKLLTTEKCPQCDAEGEQFIESVIKRHRNGEL